MQNIFKFSTRILPECDWILQNASVEILHESGSYRPRSSSPQRRFAPLVVSPQEEKSTYFVEIYVNS